MMGVNPAARPEVLRRLLPSGRGPEVEEAVMNWYQEQIELNRKDGEREGLRKGQQGTLLKLLSLRFGELPASAVARVTEADASLLDLWVERVLTATKLDDVLSPA